MTCCHHHAAQAGFDNAFTVDTSRITFGRGCLNEIGDRAAALGMSRIALFTDANIARLPFFETVTAALKTAKRDFEIYDQCVTEPTEASFENAAKFAREYAADGYISVGGGSVIDTGKAANLFATCPADLLAYVNAPIGEARPIPKTLMPHIACPTTSGTGSEVTGIAIFDLTSQKIKTGIASPKLRPTEALVDADVTDFLPSQVVACSGLDVLSHALESFTARSSTRREKPANATLRPMSQGANPWSDLGCREALSLMGRYLVRAVSDSDDAEAREQLMWAATLAGIAFGNAGVHAPHAMSYAVSGLAKNFRPVDYGENAQLVPHGMSVIVNAPAVFRVTATTSPQRHLEAARRLGADISGAENDDAGEVLAQRIQHLMRAVDMPNGIGGVGLDDSCLAKLVDGAFPQQRLLKNAPLEFDREQLKSVFSGAFQYW